MVLPAIMIIVFGVIEIRYKFYLSRKGHEKCKLRLIYSIVGKRM